VLELTSYAEVVLAPAGADASHPAFGNLFVQTEILAALDPLFARYALERNGEEGFGDFILRNNIVAAATVSNKSIPLETRT